MKWGNRGYKLSQMSDYGSDEEPKSVDAYEFPPRAQTRTKSILRKASGSCSPKSNKSVSICEDFPRPMSRQARLHRKLEIPQQEIKPESSAKGSEIMIEYTYASVAKRKESSNPQTDISSSTNCKGCSLF
mmetsp:Transcript_31992/g.55152  ORF Transcript_31992/g.55152 Transcript_31992/m.55152 type:complete len:130 (-) Transcript_31992:33-422(-)